MTKKIIAAVVIAVIGFAIGYVLHRPSVVGGAISPVGTTNTMARFFSSVINLSTTAGTSTQIQNNTGFDLAVSDVKAYCTTLGTSYTFPAAGTGLANLLIQYATTSATGLGLNGNTNFLGNLTVSTTTNSAITYVSSSTEPVGYSGARVWPNGIYLSITANATNTATCVVGVNAFAL